ncbi:hypothetical protein Gotri_026634 [Gossypium trilobum]|uniref:MADS-box domain-containing protein n=1 Tax=Gossypium trilobum TaxID=34281 RepID=A0A7J9FS27_9ROSI|nr:hypothetical protein [Gossypium trilobum]
MKKVSELSTLCEIDVCAFMYNPYETQPEVWPSLMGVQQVLSKFNNIPKMEQSKKMESQESFLSKRITKVAKQLKKHCKEIWEKEMTQCSTTFFANGSSVTPLNPQSASSSLSSSVVTLAPMMMVMPEAMSRTSTEEIRKTEVDNIEMMNNNNPQTYVGGNEMML